MENSNKHGQLSKKQRFWQVHIHAWKRSGLSQNDYCGRNQISSSQFGYWKKKLRQGSSPPVSFVPVSSAATELQTTSSGSNSGLTIFLGDSIKIGLTNDFIPATLVRVIATLGDRR